MKSKDYAIKQVLDIWVWEDELGISRNLVGSMPRHIQACVKAKGGPP